MSAYRCPTHDTPVIDATICGVCVSQLERDLAEIPALTDELNVTLARQNVLGSRDGGRSATHPLPYSPNASTVGDELKATLVGWVRDLRTDADAWPADTSVSISRWLLIRMATIRVHPAADALADEIGYAVNRVRQVIDRPVDRMFAGPCLEPTNAGPCPADLYAKVGRPTVTCPACRAEHDVAARRQWLLAEAEDRLATAVDVARAVPGLLDTEVRYDRLYDRLRQWRARGRLTPHGTDLHGHDLYRIGDVLDLLSQDRPKEKAG